MVLSTTYGCGKTLWHLGVFFCQLQCTREGSVFLCVRVVNSNLPLDVLDTTLDLIVPSSGDKPLLLAGLGNQNGGANSSFDLDTRQIGVPRLSMRNKKFDENSTNLIKKWREWRLDQVSSNHFTPQEDLKLIFSIEDTGAFQNQCNSYLHLSCPTLIWKVLPNSVFLQRTYCDK